MTFSFNSFSRIIFKPDHLFVNILNYECFVDQFKKIENNPSIIEIKRNVTADRKFSFEKVGFYEMEKLIQALNNKKAGVHLNIPTSILKKLRVIVQPLMEIWNNKIVDGKTS